MQFQIEKQLDNQLESQLEEIAIRHGFSVDAVAVMWEALVRGNGGMAQFNHPQFGGFGQWMSGGMTMIGDMFNHSLKSRVDDLCQALARLFANRPAGASPSSAAIGSGAGWWPAEFGAPASAGGQNAIRYACFPRMRRLAIDTHGQVSIYDTLDHEIGGVSQQQSGVSSLTFTSQHGRVNLEELPLVGAAAPRR